MSWETVVLSLLSGFIGTFFGAFLINKYSARKTNGIRKIAIKMLTLLKKYAKANNTFQTAKNDFNNSFTITEKRAVLVAVYKVGVPIEMPIESKFDIKNINFSSHPVDEKEIDGMIAQIKKGNCDYLFYSDVDAFFTDGMHIRLLREIAKRYVKVCLAKTHLRDGKNGAKVQVSPTDWITYFSLGESNAITTFRWVTNDGYFYEDERPKEEKINNLLSEIDKGLWDQYLQWDFSAYSGLLLQNDANKELFKLVSAQNALNQNSMPQQQPARIENAPS